MVVVLHGGKRERIYDGLLKDVAYVGMDSMC